MGVRILSSGTMSALPQPFTVYSASGQSLTFYFGPAQNLNTETTQIVMELSYATDPAIAGEDNSITLSEDGQTVKSLKLKIPSPITVKENTVL